MYRHIITSSPWFCGTNWVYIIHGSVKRLLARRTWSYCGHFVSCFGFILIQRLFLLLGKFLIVLMWKRWLRRLLAGDAHMVAQGINSLVPLTNISNTQIVLKYQAKGFILFKIIVHATNKILRYWPYSKPAFGLVTRKNFILF